MMKTPAILTIFCIHVLGVTLFATGNTFAQSPPDEVTIDQLSNLYQPVVFDHLTHTESYDCNRCHHDSETNTPREGCSTCHNGRPFGEQKACSTCHSAQIDEQQEGSEIKKVPQYHIDTPALVATYHLTCRNCHLEDNGPADCQDCHAFTEKGRKFFKIEK